jgi:PAS domain S-box-containing protein
MAEGINEVFWLAAPGFTEVQYVSPAYEAVFGRSRESLYSDPASWLDAIHPEDRVRAAAGMRGPAGGDQTYRIVRGDGTVRWIRARTLPIRDSSAEVHRQAGVAEDITDRRRAEEERDALARRLVNVQDEERRAIARELHDEIGQLLTGLRLMVEEAGVGDQAAKIGRLLKELIARVRDLSTDLRPPMLDELGLLPTLAWQIERFQARTGVRVGFHHAGVGRRFPPEVEITAVRIMQEALTNIARHAGVKEARVKTWADERGLHARIEDDGRGFEVDAALASHSIGLLGMRERCRLLGGRLVIDSTPGKGTRILVDLPFSAPPPAGR